jgi:hypothetical protein
MKRRFTQVELIRFDGRFPQGGLGIRDRSTAARDPVIERHRSRHIANWQRPSIRLTLATALLISRGGESLKSTTYAMEVRYCKWLVL